MASLPTTIYKYHGSGNDFVVIDSDSSMVADVAQIAGLLCDRHRGVGADGVIVVEPNVAGFDARMTIFNRDGSRPQMCGNGIRCVARHLVEVHSRPVRLRVATDAGERECVGQESDGSYQVDVDMGVPVQGQAIEWSRDGTSWVLHPVDMGNPHAVVFANPPLAEVDAMGAALNSPGSPFALGVNVEFTQVSDDNRVDVIVYERGVGRTQACGTGACAAAVACWSSGLLADDPIEVGLPGGRLWIRRVADRVWMRGDAELVMVAQLAPSWIRARAN